MASFLDWLLHSIDVTLTSIDRASHKVYVSHHGAFSIERLHALECYCRETSQLRVVIVCLVLSVPPFLVSIALELVPLQNPNDGWRANYGAWIRCYFIVFCVTFGILLQSKALVPEVRLSYCSILSASVGVATLCTAMTTGADSLWVFPVPFTFALVAPPFMPTISTVFVCIVGPRRLRTKSGLHRKVKQQGYILFVHSVLLFVYCLFSFLYYRLPGEKKAWCVFLLPVIKLVMQHTMAWVMRDSEQSQPIIVVFCIGVFNALFMSKCLQSAGSLVTYSMVITLDALQSILAIRRLDKTMNRIRTLAQMCDVDNLQHQNLLETVVKLSRESSVFQPRSSTSISSFAMSSQLTSVKTAPIAIIPQTDQRGSLNRVWPERISDSKVLSSDQTTRNTFLLSSLPHQLSLADEIVHATLKLLFEWEYHVLVEYVESIIPMMYATFVAIVSQLSGAAYYPETIGKSPAQLQTMVLNIAMYAWIEVLSFLLMQVSVKWRSGLSPAYLLAFVIENQALEMLSQLLVWYVVMLEFTLTHFGTYLSAFDADDRSHSLVLDRFLKAWTFRSTLRGCIITADVIVVSRRPALGPQTRQC